MPSKNNEENKGYAFVTFANPQSVTAVFSDLKRVMLRAKIVY